jgi:dihydrofolate synthase / folylpolyglutamate synthase
MQSFVPAPVPLGLERLLRRPDAGIHLGLETERAILKGLGFPELAYASVHVAGTNGKGSVCAMIESVLRAAGHRTGLYTSPHLVRFSERVRVEGRPIADADLAERFVEVEAHEQGALLAPGARAATPFELATAIAFEHFRRHNVQIAVLETGLGGRLDATNVVTPLLAVITRIDFDHMDYLGRTLEAIAGEKAGIIKPARPVVCGAMPEEARAVILAAARTAHAPVILAEEAVNVRRISQSLRGQKVKIETADVSHPPLNLPLIGKHQLENCALAVAALDVLNTSTPFTWDEQALQRGLETVEWPGRCQLLSDDPPVLLDVAHNPNGAHALAGVLKETADKRPIGLVLGMLGDKDCRGYVSIMAPLVERAWAVPVRSERALPAEDMLSLLKAANLKATKNTLLAAIAEAKAWAKEKNGLVCIAGSLYLAGEVLGELPL